MMVDISTIRGAVASIIPSPLLKALKTADGAGAYSTATFNKLYAAGLVNESYRWTGKGVLLRAILGVPKP